MLAVYHGVDILETRVLGLCNLIKLFNEGKYPEMILGTIDHKFKVREQSDFDCSFQ